MDTAWHSDPGEGGQLWPVYPSTLFSVGCGDRLGPVAQRLEQRTHKLWQCRWNKQHSWKVNGLATHHIPSLPIISHLTTQKQRKMVQRQLEAFRLASAHDGDCSPNLRLTSSWGALDYQSRWAHARNEPAPI